MAEIRVTIKELGIKFTRAELAIVKRNTPVRTGKLRRGWHLVNGDLVNKVKYCEFVEFGTKFMAARNYTKRSMNALLQSVTIRLLMQSELGRKLVNAVTLQVKRAGSFRAIYRKTINPKFYRHLLRGVAVLRREQRQAESA